MLECKLTNFKITAEQAKRINRYMLECKYDTDDSEQDNTEELIDTCWNVNTLILMTWLYMVQN